MKISEYAVKNYQFTLIMFIMVAVVGIATIHHMSRSEDPEIDFPTFPIVVVYPGASPKDIEELIVDPIEKEVYGLDNIRQVRSTTKDGLAIIQVEYKYNSNVDDKYQELVGELNALRSQLPQGIARLEVTRTRPSDVNVIQLALVSENASRSKLKQAAEDLQSALERIPALKNIEIQGLPEPIVRVDLQLDKMAQMQIPLPAVSSSLESENLNIPGGVVNEGNRSFNIKTSGHYKDIDEVSNTIVCSRNGRNVLLKDIATVYKDFEPDSHITRLNGNRCVWVVAAQKAGENISETQQAYLPVIANFKKTLPANIDMKLSFDQANHVNKRLEGLGKDFVFAILLVAITLLPLGLRAAFVVMISIPLSLASGTVLMNALGYNLNQLSIVGLVLSLGLLVDDSIVVVENIERWMHEGHSRKTATLKATSQIGTAVLGCTATLIIAFLPLLFLPEASGDFIRSLPVGVICSVISSLIVSLTVVPFLSSNLLKRHSGHPDGNLFMRGLKKLIGGSYSRLLEYALERPVITIVVCLAIFVGAVQLIPVVGFSLFPASEKPQFLVNINTPFQSNLDYTNAITKQVESDLNEIQEIEYFSSNVGKGNPQVYYNVSQENEHTDFAQVFIQLYDGTSPARKVEIIEMLRKKYSTYAGAKIVVKNFEQGPPIAAPVEVRLLGENIDTLRMLAAKVEDLVKKTTGTIYTTNPVRNLQTDIHVSVNKDKAQTLGMSMLYIDQAIRFAIAGMEIGKFNDDAGEEQKIVLTVPRSLHADMGVFDALYINNNANGSIPLKQVATLEFQASPVSINHLDKTRTVSINAFVQEGFLNDNVIAAIVAQLNNMKFPNGYRYEMGGDVESREHSFGGLGTILLITLFLFIAALILQFKTFKSTLIVLSVLPLGIVGAIFALLVTGNSLSFIATVGIIALAGIEVKNTILLVDFTNQLRRQGVSLAAAIREAGEVRFLPIVLTSLTAIGGLLPVACSSNPLVAPLAIVMIGGLISSTILSRIVTPVVYQLIPPPVDTMDINEKETPARLHHVDEV